ncbi:MAG TPA: hypothetical protein VF627_14750 [Abditibacterium sp.]|jgi:purine-cytosine permease-like protein
MMPRLKPIFGWVGVVLSAIAAATAIVGFFEANEWLSTAIVGFFEANEWLSTIGFGVAALACFKASEFFADKEK